MSKSRDLANLATAGSTVSATELGYVDGVTSAIQTQLNTNATAASTAQATADAAVPKSGYDAAGKNKIINGDFGIWQRGTSFSSGTSSQYLADRWYLERNSGTYSASQQTFTPGTAPVAGYEGSYFQRVSISVAGDIGISQRIEDVRTFAGQTVTVSFWAKATNSLSLQYVLLIQRYGSGGSSETGAANGLTGQSIGTTWQRYSYTTTLPSIAGKTIGTNSYLMLRIDPSESWTGDIDIWGVQVEAGSIATPFQTATGTKQGELAACQRYYVRMGGDLAYQYLSAGFANSTTQAWIPYNVPVTMRTAPTSLEYSTLALYNGSSVITVNSLIINSAGKDMSNLQATVSSGLLANNNYFIITNNSLSGYIALSAEL